MERVKITTFLLFVAFLALLPKMEGQPWPRPPLPSPRPLCASQFALANYACKTLPYTLEPPPLPPLPPSPDDPDSGGRHNHNHPHRHRHRHRHRSRPRETPEQDNCCRWLKGVDDECVCDMLVHLPAFLARPLHDFTVIVDESCSVTYSCASRLIRG